MFFTNTKISKIWLLKNFPFRRYDISNIFLDNIINIKYNKQFYFSNFYYFLTNFIVHEISNFNFYFYAFNKHQKIKGLNSFCLMKEKDTIYTLSDNKAIQKKIFSLMKNFLKVRGIDCSQSISLVAKFKQQKINLSNYGFVQNHNKNLDCVILNKKIREYKNKLKIIIKNNKFILVNNIIISLNKELKEWRKNHFFFDNFQLISKELDFYVNKLLWKSVKRLHSRRSKTWVYKKYWIRISGNWRFTSKDKETGKINVLMSHFYSFKPYFINRIPLITNTYKKINLKKLFFVNICKLKIILTGITSLLYNRQKGFCYKCKLPLYKKKLKIIKIKKKILILMHNTC